MKEREEREQQPNADEAYTRQRLADRLTDLSHFVQHLTWEGQREELRASLTVTAETMRAAAALLAAPETTHAESSSTPLSSDAQHPAAPDTLPASTERLKTAEKPRVEVAGRVAHPPRFELTRKNRTHLLRFSVVEYAGEQKTYHQVIAFDALADRWNGKLAKDDFVRVIGYPHIRRGRARDGTPKEFPELYAAAIRTR